MGAIDHGQSIALVLVHRTDESLQGELIIDREICRPVELVTPLYACRYEYL